MRIFHIPVIKTVFLKNFTAEPFSIIAMNVSFKKHTADRFCHFETNLDLCKIKSSVLVSVKIKPLAIFFQNVRKLLLTHPCRSWSFTEMGSQIKGKRGEVNEEVEENSGKWEGI